MILHNLILIFSTADKEGFAQIPKTLIHGEFADAGIEVMDAIGHYAGVTEPSFVVYAANKKQFDEAERIVQKFAGYSNQESYLFIDSSCQTFLVNPYTKEFIEHLGTFRVVDRESAIKEKGYTLISGRYYTAQK